MAAAASLRVGFDIGGTFTDFILLDGAGAALHIHKRLTTPADPAAGAIQGLDELLARAAVAWPDDGARRARHHDRHQRPDRAQRRPHLPNHHARFP